MNIAKKCLGKRALKSIKNGDHDALMSAIEFLIDHKDERDFEIGYNACLDDMAIYASKLAERITEEASRGGYKATDDGYYLLDQDDVAVIIKTFFDEFIERNKTE